MKRRNNIHSVLEKGFLPGCNAFFCLRQPDPKKFKTRNTGDCNAISSYASPQVWTALLTNMRVVVKKFNQGLEMR